MTIDPRWSFFLSLSLAVLSFLAGAGTMYTDLGANPATVKAILALFNICLGVGNAVNAVLAAIPSASGQSKGFYLGPKQPDPPKP